MDVEGSGVDSALVADLSLLGFIDSIFVGSAEIQVFFYVREKRGTTSIGFVLFVQMLGLILLGN